MSSDRRGLVVVPVALLADLFGGSVSVDAVAAIDNRAGTVTLVVSGQDDLPLMGPGDEMPILHPEITFHPQRSTVFRACSLHKTH